MSSPKQGYTDRDCEQDCTPFYHICKPPKSLDRVRLDALLDRFEQYEVGAVLFVAERLAKGRKTYGPLDPFDGRDWLTEAAEEGADLLVYAAAESMKRAGQ